MSKISHVGYSGLLGIQAVTGNVVHSVGPLEPVPIEILTSVVTVSKLTFVTIFEVIAGLNGAFNVKGRSK